MNNQYKDFWGAHIQRVGAVKAVTGWDSDKYTAFYREVFSDIAHRKFKTIADVGCGPALLIPLMSELYPTATYTGYDVAPEMVEHATAFNPDNDFHLIDGELELSGKYDLIICHSVLTHIYPPDAAKMLATLKEGLTKSGIISLSIHTECDSEWKGNIGRIDYEPSYFEAMVKEAGLKVSSFIDVAVPAGAVRYYRLK